MGSRLGMADPKHIASPVHIFELQRGNLSGTQPVVRQQHYNRQVAQSLLLEWSWRVVCTTALISSGRNDDGILSNA